jgi:ferritin-like metal-binding protein YciE
MWLMDQTSRADLFAELEQRVLTSRDNTAQIIRDLNEVFQRAERAKRDIAAYYRERRLQRLLGNQPK